MKRLDCILIPPAQDPTNANESVRDGVERLYLGRLLKLDDGVLDPSDRSEAEGGMPTASDRMVRVEANRLSELADALRPVPVEHAADAAERVVCLAQFRIEFECLPRQRSGLRISLGRWKLPIPSRNRLAIRESRVGWSNARVLCDRLLKVVLRSAEPFWRTPVQMVSAFQIQVVGVNVDRSTLRDRLSDAPDESQFELLVNGARDIVMNLEDVFQYTVVTLRPHMVAIGRIDELSVDAESVACLADAPFEHEPNP